MGEKNKIDYDWADYTLTVYEQKSTHLLFPLLGLNKEEKFKPQTYLFWEGEESIYNYELLVYYPYEGSLFDRFVETKIMTHKLLKICYSVEGGMLFIFDLVEFYEDVLHFLEGQYSKMSDKAKGLISKYHGDYYKGDIPKKGHPVHMILNPHIYYDVVQKELNCSMSAIRTHGELWDKYDDEEEMFKNKVLENCDCVEQKTIFYNK